MEDEIQSQSSLGGEGGESRSVFDNEASGDSEEVNDDHHNSGEDSGDSEEYSDINSTSCLAPDITNFPNPLIKKQARQRGAVIIHILLAIYMFLGMVTSFGSRLFPAY